MAPRNYRAKDIFRFPARDSLVRNSSTIASYRALSCLRAFYLSTFSVVNLFRHGASLLNFSFIIRGYHTRALHRNTLAIF